MKLHIECKKLVQTSLWQSFQKVRIRRAKPLQAALFPAEYSKVYD